MTGNQRDRGKRQTTGQNHQKQDRREKIRRLDPELRLAISMLNMNMSTPLLAGKK